MIGSRWRGALSLVALLAPLACTDVSDLFGTTNAGGTGGVGGSGGDGGAGLTPGVTQASRADVLLVIDNSHNMGDKHALLSETVPRLIDELAPIDDIHLGVITSSLGSRGASACVDRNDHAYLIEHDENDVTVPTYQSLGYLAWDPKGELSPPGEDNPGELTANLTSIIVGAGQEGCGFEAVMESWYRFLVDPNPYEDVVVESTGAKLVGTDDTVLTQRREFLRPDSLLIIIQLSDENDCSIRDGGQFFYAMEVTNTGGGLYHLPRPRAACASDPNSPCCRSCGQPPGDGCDTAMDDCNTPLTTLEDNVNLRCFDQKRRFGIDFMQPIDRYVTALTAKNVPDRDGNIEPNPLFQDLDPSDGIDAIRDPSLVVLTSIVGVPWQDIARTDASGSPDLTAGTKLGAEMVADATWDLVLGDPPSYKPPLDPLMRESIQPRSGVHPVTGQPIAPPGSGYEGNAINGHEYSIPANDNLQYTCVFELPVPRDCAMASANCECANPGDDPLCQNPATDQYGTVQYRAKAYPGLRYLQAAKALGAQAVVGSVCPAQLDTTSSSDYGLVPVMRAVGEATEGKRK